MIYVKLNGDRLDLSNLTGGERVFLSVAASRFRAQVTRRQFLAFYHGPNNANPLLKSCSAGFADHPLYRALMDMEVRLGIADGTFLPRPEDDPGTDPFTGERVESPAKTPA